jgi:hypothetical protein
MTEKKDNICEDQHTINYYNQMGLDVKKLLKKKLASYKMAAPPIDIPDVEEEATSKKEEVAPKLPEKESPVADSSLEDNVGDVESIQSDLENISKGLDKIELEQKFENMKDEIIKEFTYTIKDLKQEVDDLKDRKVPDVGSFDSQGVFKEKLFEIVTRVLDESLVHIFNDVPDYSLISSQVSRTFENGTVSDAIVAVSATVSNEGYRYDFKVDVPILNGIVHYPQYIQRGLKIIPLTPEKIMEELESVSFRKIEPDHPYSKDNIYNNVGDNIHRKPDKQKWYGVENYEPNTVGMPPNNTWYPSKQNMSKPRKEEN